MTTPTALDAIDLAQVAGYHADGFLVVRNVFSPDRIEELSREAEEAA